MTRTRIRNPILLVTLAAIAALLTPTTPTLAAPDAAPASLAARDVREHFTRCGYDAPSSATPTPYVAIRDRGAPAARDGDYRVLMAVVYASADAALTAHRQAHQTAEQRLGERWPFSNDNGPQLLSAYSGSVWRANVALVQSSFRTLASIHSVDDQTGEDRVARPELLELGFVQSRAEYGVDRDFVGCLESALTADGATPAAAPIPAAAPLPIPAAAPAPPSPTSPSPTLVYPVFMPGLAW